MQRLVPLCLLLAPLLVHAGWVDRAGHPVPDTASMRSQGGFLVQLALTLDEKELRQAWDKASSTPVLQTTDAVRRGADATAVLILRGCEPAPSGACDVMAEFVVQGPDGQRASGGAGSLWSSPPMPGKFMLGAASMSLRFGPEDDAGTYTVQVTVTDRIAQRTLQLSSPLRVD